MAMGIFKMYSYLCKFHIATIGVVQLTVILIWQFGKFSSIATLYHHQYYFLDGTRLVGNIYAPIFYHYY